jgi:hypothetical protein
MPVRTYLPGSSIGGGLYSRQTLKFNSSWDTVLQMDQFIELKPGHYTLRIQYHDSKTIADMESTGDLILVHSDSIRLHVQPRIIQLRTSDKEKARNWLTELDENDTLKVLAGTYGSHAHDFISPDSAPGQLLQLRWKAVPVLLEQLADEKLTPAKRAWVLALLFSITGRNDPRLADGVLPSFRYREVGWQVWGGTNGKMNEGGIGFGGDGSVWSGSIDTARQQEFAKQWQRFKDFIVVKRARSGYRAAVCGKSTLSR